MRHSHVHAYVVQQQIEARNTADYSLLEIGTLRSNDCRLNFPNNKSETALIPTRHENSTRNEKSLARVINPSHVRQNSLHTVDMDTTLHQQECMIDLNWVFSCSCSM